MLIFSKNFVSQFFLDKNQKHRLTSNILEICLADTQKHDVQEFDEDEGEGVRVRVRVCG